MGLQWTTCTKSCAPDESHCADARCDQHRYFGVSDDKSDRLMRSDLTGRNLEEPELAGEY